MSAKSTKIFLIVISVVCVILLTFCIVLTVYTARLVKLDGDIFEDYQFEVIGVYQKGPWIDVCFELKNNSDRVFVKNKLSLKFVSPYDGEITIAVFSVGRYIVKNQDIMLEASLNPEPIPAEMTFELTYEDEKIAETTFNPYDYLIS